MAGTNSITVSPGQASMLLDRAMPARHPILLVGGPGVGKTDIVHASAQRVGYDLIVSHPAVSDPTDFKGLPWKGDGSYAEFLPFGEFYRALRATRPTLWFFDDLGQAPNSVQAAAMQLFLARRVGDHVLPDVVTLMAATNRRGDRAGVQGLLEPLKSRFTTIVEVEPTIDDWMNWAFTHDVAEQVIAFLKFRSDLLNKFEPTQDITNSPCPRTWAAVSDLIKLDLPNGIQLASFGGAVGVGAAEEFVSFLRVYENLPDPDAVLADPERAPVPSEPSVLYALATSLAVRTTVKNFSAIAKYASRLYNNQKGEFAAVLVLGAYRKEKGIRSTPEFARFAETEVGKLIAGGGN